MRTVFNEMEVWSPKKRIGVQNKDENIVIRVVKNRVVINPEKFLAASITTFDPLDDDEVTKTTQHYLELHELEMFTLFTHGLALRGLVKPKDIPLEKYLEL